MWGSIRYFICHVTFPVGIAGPGWPLALSSPTAGEEDMGPPGRRWAPPEQAGWEQYQFQLGALVPPKTGHLVWSKVAMEMVVLYRSSHPIPGLPVQLEISLNLVSEQLRTYCWRWLTSAAVPHHYTEHRHWSRSGQSHNDKASGLLK